MMYKFANNMLTEHHILSMGLCLTLTTSDGSSGMLGACRGNGNSKSTGERIPPQRGMIREKGLRLSKGFSHG